MKFAITTCLLSGVLALKVNFKEEFNGVDPGGVATINSSPTLTVHGISKEISSVIFWEVYKLSKVSASLILCLNFNFSHIHTISIKSRRTNRTRPKSRISKTRIAKC